MSKEYKNLKVYSETKDRFMKHLEKSPYGSTVDKLLNQLLDIAEMEATLQLPGEAPPQ